MSYKPARIRFETKRLEDGPITHDLDVTPDVLDLCNDPEYAFREHVIGRITATLVGTTVLLTGYVKTVAAAPCARCLTDLRVPLRADLTLTYMQDDRLLDPIRYPELYDDNTFWYDGDIVWPGEQLRELLLLQLPTVTRCELEKENFCPVRGVELQPTVFGPVEEFETARQEEEAELGGSFAAQMKAVRQRMQP